MPGGSNDYGIPHHPERFQDVANQSRPPPEIASRLSDHASIPVTVRIVRGRDGEQWLDGTATPGTGSTCASCRPIRRSEAGVV